MSGVSGSATPPAVVVGAAGACGLGVVRSLSRAGVPVVLLDDDPAAPAMHSRFGRKLAVRRLSGPPLIDDLLSLAPDFPDRPVLFLTSDEAVLTVSEHRADLAGRYRFRLPDHDRLVSMMHKTSFQQLAERRGLPVPRSIRITGDADLGRLSTLRFPAIIKPAIKGPEYVRGGFPRAFKAASAEEAEAACRRILPVLPGVVVQEWIDGGDGELYFCLQYRGEDGAPVCSFTGRKLSIWPPDVGVTASCTAAPEAEPALEALTDQAFRHCAFAGMGGLEFKRDGAGRFLIIEPTVGRVDAQEEVATLHGVNIPLAAYRYELGLAVPRMERRSAPVVWRDAWAHCRSRRAGRTVPPARIRTRTYDAYWRLDDPLPAFYHVLGGSVKSLRHTVRSAAHRPPSTVSTGASR